MDALRRSLKGGGGPSRDKADRFLEARGRRPRAASARRRGSRKRAASRRRRPNCGAPRPVLDRRRSMSPSTCNACSPGRRNGSCRGFPRCCRGCWRSLAGIPSARASRASVPPRMAASGCGHGYGQRWRSRRASPDPHLLGWGALRAGAAGRSNKTATPGPGLALRCRRHDIGALIAGGETDVRVLAR